MTRKEELQERMKELLESTCNFVGCGKCGLEYGNGECSMTSLQDEILEYDT